MGCVMSIDDRPARGTIVPAASSNPIMEMVPGLLELGAQAVFAPATVALLAFNALRFLPHDLSALLLSHLYHVSGSHLFGNMAWCVPRTGVVPESASAMGTADFASLVAALVGLSPGATAAKSKAVVSKLLDLGLQAPLAPATAALLAANVLVYLRPGPLDVILPSVDDVAFRFRQPGKLKALLSSFYHRNLKHLRSNMVCLLQTGAALESSMGTADYASMVAALVGLSHSITVLLCKGVRALMLLDRDDADAESYDYSSVGFSDIIFAMETVSACSRRVTTREFCVYSTRVSEEYAGLLLKYAPVLWKLGVCADLFIVQAMNPGGDFLGHLGGLLAGFLCYRLKCSLKGAEPLTWLISRGVRSLTVAATCAQQHLTSAILPTINKCCTSRTTAMTAEAGGGGDGGRRRECLRRGIWTCSTCDHYNSIATDTCEVCSTMREDCTFSRRRPRLASSSSSSSSLVVVLRT